MKTLLWAALAAGCLAWTPPARSAASDGPEAKPTDSDRPDSKETWEDYRIKARQDLDVVEHRIAGLETRAKITEAEASEGFRAQVKSLRAMKNDADRLMGQFETATETARKELRVKFDRKLREIKKAIRKAEAKPQERT